MSSESDRQEFVSQTFVTQDQPWVPREKVCWFRSEFPSRNLVGGSLPAWACRPWAVRAV